jgi:hypothetical protein
LEGQSLQRRLAEVKRVQAWRQLELTAARMIKCSASRRTPLQQLLQLWQRLQQQRTPAVARISNSSIPWQLRR